jgi:hypothetical protein
MSSPVRRALRSSVAAAGFTALGLGLAGPAPAAPALPAVDGLPAVPELPAAPALESSAVPGAARVEVPEVSTAGPQLPAGEAFAVPGLPATPATGAPAVRAPSTPAAPDGAGAGLPSADSAGAGDEQDAAPPIGLVDGGDRLGAMQALDAAALVQQLAQTGGPGGPTG